MIENDSAGTLFADKKLCLSFMSLETRTKKLAGGEGEMFCQFLAFPRILPVTASWLFMSPLASVWGSWAMAVALVVIWQGLPVLSRAFLLPFLQVWVKLWCIFFVLGHFATHDITPGWNQEITWELALVRQAIGPQLPSYWNRVHPFLHRRWPV